MRFGLRRQLFAIGLLTLALPVASVFYIRETEQALRNAQAGFLGELARGLVPLLPAPAPPLDAGASGDALYAHALARDPVLDGFSDDWGLAITPEPTIVGGRALRVLVGEHRGTLWIAASASHESSATPTFEIVCSDAQSTRRQARIRPVAPGAVRAESEAIGFEDRLRGVWQTLDDGSRLELRLPQSLCARRLGVTMTAGQLRAGTYRGDAPGALVQLDPVLSGALARNVVPGMQSFVVDAQGFRVTPVTGQRRGRDAAVDDDAFSALYRHVLGRDDAAQSFRPAAIAHDGGAIEAALAGRPGAGRYRTADGATVLVAARPLGSGALVLVQDAEAVLTLANPALKRLTMTILGVTLTVVVAMLAYASWLSWRVRRLAQRVTRAVDARGNIQQTLPETRAGDEIGDLARDVRSMLARTAEQQHWLATMADTLSHELRTPLAIVQSSLDNLDQHDLDERQRELTERASTGVQRLRRILNAVSGARRAEQAARDGDAMPVPLATLIEQLAQAYGDTFDSHRFAARIGTSASVLGSAELLVQAIDKLVENAVRFAPEGATIELRLEAADGEAVICVRNPGPPLPAGDPARLFDSFVSLDSGGGHLGFGLYIARLIIEAHGGSAAAMDWRDGEQRGVEVTLRLPMRASSDAA